MQLFNKIFKRDSYAFGAFLGLVSPVVLLFVLFYGVNLFSGVIGFQSIFIGNFYLISIVINLLYMRLYLVSYKFEKTGKSMVIITFLYVILFFIFKP